MNCLNEINSEGFVVIEDVFSGEEIKKIILEIEKITSSEVENSTFRKSEDLFAIRQFHKEVPESLKFIFNSNLLKIIKSIKGEGSFITKSIYFDKPEKSNWFVSYHQDLTISVNKKIESENFKNWTVKQNQYSVQPPVSILDSAFTVRIHLDKTTKENGALKVLNGTHKNGVIRVENIDSKNEVETICEVGEGGVMLMKPLLFHASNKTINNERRRVIHIEFNNQELPYELEWNEKTKVL
jgi:ectoine hydroxylase-related dioxygenase (phytanoyl-CoA dioxygenase family)